MEKLLFTINGDSLYPTFKSGDIVEIKPIKKVKRNDYVVFELNGRKVCKKVVGIPGDTFEIISDNLVINNSKQYPMLGRVTLKHFSEAYNKIIPEDEYILLGNLNSTDSANFGLVSRKLIIGKLDAKS